MTKGKNGTPVPESAARISNSFTDGEIKILDFVVTTLLRGGDARAVVRNEAFRGLARKVQGMKQRVEEKRGRPMTPLQLAPPPPSGDVEQLD